jgi:energy-coupling factor transporter ATP-binding protein EcfA2
MFSPPSSVCRLGATAVRTYLAQAEASGREKRTADVLMCVGQAGVGKTTLAKALALAVDVDPAGHAARLRREMRAKVLGWSLQQLMEWFASLVLRQFGFKSILPSDMSRHCHSHSQLRNWLSKKSLPDDVRSTLLTWFNHGTSLTGKQWLDGAVDLPVGFDWSNLGKTPEGYAANSVAGRIQQAHNLLRWNDTDDISHSTTFVCVEFTLIHDNIQADERVNLCCCVQ